MDIAKHIAENRDGFTIETPGGWVMAWRPGPDSIYIDDICIYPEFRNSGFVVALATVVEDMARHDGCRYLYTNIHPTVEGADRMEHIVLEFGFEKYLSSEIINVYRKELV